MLLLLTIKPDDFCIEYPNHNELKTTPQVSIIIPINNDFFTFQSYFPFIKIP